MTMNVNEKNDRIDNIDDSVHRKHQLKNEILADKICRLLFGHSINLLDELFAHPLSIDYFNVYLSLPIFGQRILYQQMTHQFQFDPPLLSSSSKDQTNEQVKEWLINYRLNNYIHTDIYIESLLGLLLTRIDDDQESSTKLHTFIESNTTKIEQSTYVFSTVNDIRQFHQFLQSNLGIKYWDFFIDSMRLLRSRHSTQTSRIDISSLNFIYKYNSRQAEFRSIILNPNKPSMPLSSTSDIECCHMAINAMEQLRIYWLPRYLTEISSSSPLKREYRTNNENSNEMKNISSSSSKASKETSSIDLIKPCHYIKHTIGNISYLNYNPQEYLHIQPSDQDNVQQDDDPFNQSDEPNQTENDHKLELNDILPVYSGRSLENYANNNNLELFYRIFVSDFFAGSPFSQYILHTKSKTDGILYQTCLCLISDTEILFSIPSGKFQERIVRQFILKYIHVTTTKELPSQIEQHIEDQRTNLIEELTINNQKSFPHLWKLLLNITQCLIPHFLDYVKYDRFRFLLQGKVSDPIVILNDLHRIFPSVNFEPTLINRLMNKIMIFEGGDTNEREFNSQLTLTHCGGQQDDLINPLMNKQWMTTEKLINTDEQCPFQTGEHFPPLTDIELEEELNRYCSKFQWNEIQNILGKTFNISITSHSSDATKFIGHPSLTSKLHETSIFDGEFMPMNAIELFTLDVLHSAREIIEIDRFVNNIMDEGRNIFHRNASLHSTALSLVYEEILLTDSSPAIKTTSSKSILNSTNNNAYDIHYVNNNHQSIPIQTKTFSSIGSYLINTANLTCPQSQVHIQSIRSSELKQKLLTINPRSTNFFHETIKFARKDATNEVNNLLLDQRIFQRQNDNQEQLLDFIHNQILNYPWPLEEYIGLKGHRAWHALTLAAKISNLDDGLMFNYHHHFDWIFFDNNLGSFGERSYVIQRNFS